MRLLHLELLSFVGGWGTAHLSSEHHWLRWELALPACTPHHAPSSAQPASRVPPWPRIDWENALTSCSSGRVWCISSVTGTLYTFYFQLLVWGLRMKFWWVSLAISKGRFLFFFPDGGFPSHLFWIWQESLSFFLTIWIALFPIIRDVKKKSSPPFLCYIISIKIFRGVAVKLT